MQTSREGYLPNLIIIGAMKAGTTSLHYYLNLHPQVCMSREKELDFFIEERNWHKGIQWYKSHFLEKAKVYGESSPNYTNYPKWKGIPERMFSVIPETKLIYILRNPIERIVSHYMHIYASGIENRSFKEAMAEFDETNWYIQRSKYFLQLEQYLKLFSKSSLLIITSEELSNFPQKTMKKVFQFLGVDPEFKFKLNHKSIKEFLKFGPGIAKSNFAFDVKLHQSSIKARINCHADGPLIKNLSKVTSLLPPEIRNHAEKIIYRPFSQKIERPKIDDMSYKKLLNYFADDINQLKQYTGHEFKEWNI